MTQRLRRLDRWDIADAYDDGSEPLYAEAMYGWRVLQAVRVAKPLASAGLAHALGADLAERARRWEVSFIEKLYGVDEFADRDLRLASLGIGRNELWPTDANLEARCAPNLGDIVLSGVGVSRPDLIHEAPGLECKCGIYAVRDPRHALAYMNYGRVLCRVALSGRVIQGTKGWRAQLARVEHVTTHAYGLTDEELGRLAHAYQVPLVAPPDEVLDAPPPPGVVMVTTALSAGQAAASFAQSMQQAQQVFGITVDQAIKALQQMVLALGQSIWRAWPRRTIERWRDRRRARSRRRSRARRPQVRSRVARRARAPPLF